MLTRTIFSLFKDEGVIILKARLPQKRTRLSHLEVTTWKTKTMATETI